MSKTLIKRVLHNPILELHQLFREQKSEEAEILLNALLGEQKK
jgi:glutamyl-tRNA reductase